MVATAAEPLHAESRSKPLTYAESTPFTCPGRGPLVKRIKSPGAAAKVAKMPLPDKAGAVAVVSPVRPGQPVTLSQQHDAMVAAGKASGHDSAANARDKAKAKIFAVECTYTMADDLWNGHDYALLWNERRSVFVNAYVGSGTAKIVCGNPDCARRTPPNNVRDLVKREYLPGHGTRWRVVGRDICDDCREAAKAPPERVHRVKLDEGSAERVLVSINGPVVATAAVAAAYGVKVEAAPLPVGGKAEPAPPQFSDDMTAEERRLVLAEYQREVAAYDDDTGGMSDALATYNARMMAEPGRWREWLREFERGAAE